MRHQIVRARAHIATEHDERLEHLTPIIVRDADHRSIRHRWMCEQYLLDLARINVDAAGNDEVLLAVDKIDVTFLVALGHVAGREPVAAKRGARLFGASPIAVVVIGGAAKELAHRAWRNLAAI